MPPRPPRGPTPVAGARPPSVVPSSGSSPSWWPWCPRSSFPASSLPGDHGPQRGHNWSNYNYEGYEGQASYPEFHSLMQTMADLGKRYGCGRAMWEYSSSENRFGTPEALMLLPY